MTPIKIVIPGTYVDSQLHDDRLYIWNAQGTVSTLSLPLLVKSFATDASYRILTNAFLKAGSLYYPMVDWDVRQDIDVASFLRAKFEVAATQGYVLDEGRLSASLIAQQQSLSPFPHADSVTYGGSLYTVGKKGVHRTAVSKRGKLPLSPRVKKLWDAPTNNIDAGWGSLALAAGNDGLWEATHRRDSAKPTQVSPAHANSCEFAFQSIFATSHVNGGYLADYDMLPGEERRRRFSRILFAKSIFQSSNLTFAWACREKICAVTDSNILVKKYIPWSETARIANQLAWETR